MRLHKRLYGKHTVQVFLYFVAGSDQWTPRDDGTQSWVLRKFRLGKLVGTYEFNALVPDAELWAQQALTQADS